MKKFIILAIAITIITSLPLLAKGQTTNLLSFQIGGGTTTFTVYNNTDDAKLIVQMCGKQGTVREKAGSMSVSAGFFSRCQGEVLVAVTVCSEILDGFNFNEAPAWAQDEGNFPGFALTDEFLQSHPKIKDIDRRVAKVKDALKDYPGGKERGKELDAWRKYADHAGVTEPRLECGHAVPIITRGYNFYDGYNRTPTETIVGNRESGYRAVNNTQAIF